MRTMLGLGGLALIACGGAAAVSSPSTPVPTPLHAPEPMEACALKLAAPNAQHPARVPEDLYARALAPVVAALCACTRSDDRTRIQAQVLPERGEVRASAPEDPRIDACLAVELKPGRFARFDAPPGADCSECGPLHLVPARPGPVERFRATLHPEAAKARERGASTPPVALVYALSVDRKRNELRDANGPHVPDVDDQ